MSVQTYTWSVEVIPCAECGMPFGLSLDFIRRRREDGQSFWCPNKHSNYYGETEIKKLQRQLKLAQDGSISNREWAEREQQQRLKTERRVSALKGVVTRGKRRAHHGVCPVDGCRRTFSNLRDHMHNQHPGWVDKEPAET